MDSKASQWPTFSTDTGFNNVPGKQKTQAASEWPFYVQFILLSKSQLN